MTQASATSYFGCQFLRSILERRNLVLGQKFKEIRTRNAEQLGAFARGDAALVVPFHHCCLVHFAAKTLGILTEQPHRIDRHF